MKLIKIYSANSSTLVQGCGGILLVQEDWTRKKANDRNPGSKSSSIKRAELFLEETFKDGGD